MAKAKTLDDFLKDTENFLKVERMNAKYDDYWKAFKQAEEEDKLMEQETGQNPGKADKNSQDYQEADAAKELTEMYRSRTAAKVKSNLATITRDAAPDKLVRTLTYTLSHEKGDKDLQEMFRDYKLYDQFRHPRKDMEEEEKQELFNKVIKNLPKIITARIEEQTGDKEYAEKWGKYLAAANSRNGKYIVKKVEEEVERIENELKGKIKSGSIASYIISNIKEDKEYAEFAKNLYKIETAEKEK